MKKGIIQEIKKSELKQNCFMNIIVQISMRALQTGASL